MISGRTVRIQQDGARLDAALLVEFPGTTRALIREAVSEGGVLVNGSAAPKGRKLRAGDVVEVKALAEVSDNTVEANPAIEPRLVFEDQSLLAFDKPAGMPVQPISRHETGTLANGVVARWPECATAGDTPLSAGAVHRIDANTSGLVMVARTRAAFDSLRAQFSAHKVKKTDLVLVEGCVAVGGSLECDLAHDPTLPFCRMIDADRNRLTRAQRAGLRRLHAVTAYTPVVHTARGEAECTLLEVEISTGVTHQIRAQLAFAGMHIVNDRLYGAFAVENMQGHCLHALAAKFTHPESGDPAEIRTPFPDWAGLS